MVIGAEKPARPILTKKDIAMTNDEKAKAYEMALEAARKELDNDRKELPVLERVLGNIFPELSENEDERERRMLDTITYKMSQHQPDIFTGEENEWFNAYLEKQKELFESGRGLYYYDGEKTIYIGYPTTEENPYDFAMSQQEEQKEQPTNEEMLRTLRYEYEKGVADTIAKYEQKEQKPAESDAIKGGDFISDGERVFLVLANVKERNLGETGSTFCEGHILGVDGVVYCDGGDFKKFKRATSDERAKFIHDLKVGVKLKEQPAEWSEFDKDVLNDAITAVDLLGNGESFNKDNPNLAKAFRIAKDWLKSLPERFNLQSKQEWSKDYREEDIQTRFAFYTYKDDPSVLYLSNVFVEETSRNHGFGTRILKAAEKAAEAIGAITICLKVKQDSPANAWYRKRGYGYVAFEDGYDWLEKNLEYLKPVKQKWSEEDETTIDCAVEVVEKAGLPSLAASLKSLRNRPKSSDIWKPSEEQMGALNYAYGELFKRRDVGHNILGPLLNLIDTLSKL